MPEPWIVGLLALAAFAAGLVDAIAGGGGLVTVPALLAAGLPPQIALATNKGQACFGAISSFASFWTKKVELVRHYDRVAGLRVPVRLDTTAQIRLAGTSTMTITYDYEMVNGVAVR